MSDQNDSTTPDVPPYGSGEAWQQAPQPQPSADDIVMAGPEPKPGRHNTPMILSSIVVVMALIIGGAAFGAYRLLASHGDQPEKWAPASSIAYVKVDLDPSAAEKISVYKFAKHFPDTPKANDYGDLKETVFEKAFQDSPFDWNADIKPWLGDRVGVAFFPYDGSVAPIGILQHKDKAKAKAALAKVADQGDDFAYAVEDDYAIVGTSQGAVDAAVKAAKTKSLADNADFSSDLGALPSDRILAVWVDLPSLSKQINDALSSGGAAMLPGGLSALGIKGTPALHKGRVAFTVSVEPDYVELQARAFGVDKADLQNGKAGTQLAALPSHTVLGIALAHPDNLARTSFEGVLKSPMGEELSQRLDAASQTSGFDLPDDAYKILGSSITFALQTWPLGEDATSARVPSMRLATEPSDMGLADKLANQFASEAESGLPFEVKAKGDTFTATTDGYDDTGTLGDASRFRSAMGDVSGDVAIACYIDLHSLWQVIPADVDQNAKQLSAVGIVAGTDSTPYLRLRAAVG